MSVGSQSDLGLSAHSSDGSQLVIYTMGSQRGGSVYSNERDSSSQRGLYIVTKGLPKPERVVNSNERIQAAREGCIYTRKDPSSQRGL